MKSKGPVNWQQQYKVVKCEFDELLEKNQNDLIKIKIREKQLQDKIASIQQENEELKKQIQTLQNQLRKSKGLINSDQLQQENQNLKILLENKVKEIYSLTKQTSENQLNSDQQTDILRKELKETKGAMNLFEKQIIESKNRIENAEKEKIVLEKGRNEACEKVAQLEKSANDFNQQLKIQRQELYQQFGQKDREITSLQQSLNNCKSELQSLSKKQCQKCIELSQEIQLQKQMVKSARMMLRVKQMELQAFKK